VALSQPWVWGLAAALTGSALTLGVRYVLGPAGSAAQALLVLQGCLLLAAGTSAAALGRASRRLSDAVGTERERARGVESSLVATEAKLRAQHREGSERVHDARNIVTSLRASTETLLRYGKSLPEDVQRQLRAAVDEELAQLEHLVSRRASSEATFDLLRALGPVVAAERATGLDVQLRCGAEVLATGRREDFLRAVQNLLANARRHAPGASVTVRVTTTGPAVQVRVTDDGPGVSEALRPQVFERGVSRDRELGDGLGLGIARELMRRQGGDLTLGTAEGGAEFVLTLPRAELAPLPHQRDGGSARARLGDTVAVGADRL
jgi:two-component system OmpR family sensor kinase